jgi:general secretion pathway protein G
MKSLLTRLARRRRAGNQMRTGERGYSLLEVLIVLTIIALVATLVGPRLMAQLDRSKVKAACVQIGTLASTLEAMHIDLGRYPTNQEGLALLVEPPAGERDRAKWRHQYLDAAVPDDPWGKPFVYISPQGDFARPIVKSLGSDGVEGGEGLAADIENGCDP